MAIGRGRGRGARITMTKSAGTSPVLSRRGSRTRGSGRGSDLYLTPTASNTGALRKAESPVAGMTPNFLDPEEPELGNADAYDPDDLDRSLGDVDEDADEEEDQEEIDEVEREMQRLTRERGFGLGGLVDRVMGWTLFENNEDDLTTATVQVHNLSKTRSERESTDISGVEVQEAAGGTSDGDAEGDMKDEKEDVIREAGRPRQGEEGEVRWEDDAAWLMRVAGKIIL
jgi:hypothetical protein